jgi:threonine aldolase
MLSAIIHTTLRDDVFMEDPTTTGLEQHIASLTGYEAAMFVITGTMANQLALRTHLTQPPHAILTDAQAHIVHWEAGGIASASGALLQAVSPSNATYLTLEDIKLHAETTDDVHKCPTRVISLENTVAGSVFPLSELRRISQWARNQEPPILLHLDGARLWEAVATGAGNLRDYAELFDSLSLDFSKNLGAPMGAMVLSSARFIKQSRRIRKSIGGGMRQAGVLSSACRVAVDEVFGPGVWGFRTGGQLRSTHEKAKRLGDTWMALGGKLERKVETNMLWLDLKDVGISSEQLNEVGKRHGVKLDGRRICLHHQISEESLLRLCHVFEGVLSSNPKL